jgi:CBS domain-containing protein
MALHSLKVSDIPLKTSLVSLKQTEAIDKSFSKLFDNQILSAPVLDDEGRVTGLLAMIDIAVFAVNLAKTSQNLVAMLGLPIEHPEMLSNFDDLPDLFTGDKRLEDAFGTNAADFMKNFSRRNPTKTVSYAGSWWDLVKTLTEVRRVVVVDAQGHLVNYITQSDIIKLLSSRALFNDKAQMSIADLKIGSSPVFSIKDNQRVLEAFKLFALHEIEAVPVLSAETGKVIGNISATDIRVMKASSEAIDSLYLTYPEFVKRMTQYNIPSAPVTVTSSMSLGKVVELLLKHKIHRVFVVDGDALKAVVSMTDVLKALVH